MKRKREKRGEDRGDREGRRGGGVGKGRGDREERRGRDVGKNRGDSGGGTELHCPQLPPPPPPIPHPAAASARSWRSSQSTYELRLKLYRNYFQTKPSAAARLNRKFSTTAVSLRCFSDSKVTLAFPPSSGSTASFLRLLMRSFVLTDSS